MKRFALLFVAVALAIQITGCGADSSSATQDANDPHVSGEAKAYKEKEAEKLAERAAKAAAKASKSAPKKQ
jgi:hypothetical protein